MVLLPSKFLLGYNDFFLEVVSDTRSATIEIFARLQHVMLAYLQLLRSATIEIFARLQLLHHSTYTNYRSATIEIFARLQQVVWRR